MTLSYSKFCFETNIISPLKMLLFVMCVNYHGPLSIHPCQIELDFVNPPDRHLAVFTSPAYKDDITFDKLVLWTVSC